MSAAWRIRFADGERTTDTDELPAESTLSAIIRVASDIASTFHVCASVQRAEATPLIVLHHGSACRGMTCALSPASRLARQAR